MAYITNKTKNVQGSSLYITDALQERILYEGVNNINVSGNLPLILDLTYHTEENPYYDVIYSQDDVNDIKIWFNNVEFENAADYVETLTGTLRILPNDGSKRFSLGNFVSKELELTIHETENSYIANNLQDQVKISIGTMIENNYQYVPIGIFNIQDTPVNNNGKYVIKLRDNRVKFDFNYNAKTLIDNQYVATTDTVYLDNKNYYSLVSAVYVLLVAGTDYTVGDSISGTVYEEKGTATLEQILNDICNQAGVTNLFPYHFDGYNQEVAIYDNTIQATKYVSYIAEQGGYTPTIDREGNLKAVNWNNLYTWRIPLSIVSDDYKKGESFEIQRVVYESGVVKYESSSDETLDTLFLDASNPYITSQSQIDNIYNKLNGFTIDSVTTQNFLGNPAIDPYDIIEVYDDEDVNEPVIFRTLANYNYSFNGKHSQSFDTQIGVEARTENVSKNSEATFRKWAKTEIDNTEGIVSLQAGLIEENQGYISELQVANDNVNIAINRIGTNIDANGNVTEVTTTSGFTFNEEGLNISKSETDYHAQHTNEGSYYKDGTTDISIIDKDGVMARDFKQKGLHQYGWDETSQSYNFSKEGVEVTYTDEFGQTHTKTGYGTFYNG